MINIESPADIMSRPSHNVYINPLVSIGSHNYKFSEHVLIIENFSFSEKSLQICI